KGCVIGQSWIWGWCPDKDAALKQVGQELEIALALDDNDPDVHRVLAALNLTFDNHDKATYHQQRALSLNPNNDLIVVQQGELLTWLGRAEEGIDWIRRAMRSIRTIPSATGIISAGPSTRRAPMPTQSNRSAASRGRITPITRFWR